MPTLNAQLTCPCNHCAGLIQFDENREKETVECPHCGGETTLWIRKEIDPQPVEKRNGYIEKVLMTDESLVYRTKLHWSVFFPAFSWLGVAVLCSVFGMENGFVMLGLILFLFLVMPMMAGAFVRLKTSEFGVTTKRIILKTGFISRSSTELMLGKVEAANVDQSILGRILNYGTIRITGTGGSQSCFHRIKDPLEFHSEIQQQISNGSKQ